MSHLTLPELTDHLLGEADEAAARRVSSHLDSECQPCDRLVRLLARVQRVGRRDAHEAPPAAAVRTVKALVGFQRARPAAALALAATAAAGFPASSLGQSTSPILERAGGPATLLAPSPPGLEELAS